MKNLCLEFNISQSFSKKGCLYDNACIESFHASIKKEEIHLNAYKNFKEAKIAIFRYIESWYNNKRLHSAINYKTPNEVELLAKNVTSKSSTFCVQNIDIRPIFNYKLFFYLKMFSFA
ncbi:MAG: transposase [Sarcina sp.]